MPAGRTQRKMAPSDRNGSSADLVPLIVRVTPQQDAWVAAAAARMHATPDQVIGEAIQLLRRTSSYRDVEPSAMDREGREHREREARTRDRAADERDVRAATRDAVAGTGI